VHLGRKYKFTEYVVWTRREIGYLLAWSLFATLLLEVTRWNFLSIPAPLLAVVGSAVAIVLAFKNQQCYARGNEALTLSSQLISQSIVWANKLALALGSLDGARSGLPLKEIFYRHFAWLTALRFYLREPKTWENTFEPGNANFLIDLQTPESRSALKNELTAYFSDAELQKVVAHRGDKEALILHGQYQALEELRDKNLISELIFVTLIASLDDLVRLQGALKRIKNYPYPRNYYSSAIFSVIAFVAIMPFGFFPYAQELGKSAGIEHWTVWLNVPFSVFVGWIFVALEKVGENSSNPFEGGPNDAPISFIARRIEIEMRLMLGEQTELKPIEPYHNILF
jgi:ion channel-forming bestrophin family protein